MSVQLRRVVFFLFGFLVVTALCFAFAGNLPTPTPGLTENGQMVNHKALTQGKVIETKVLYGREYTIRQLGSVLILYNDKGHAIALCQCGASEIEYVLAESSRDPFPATGDVRKLKMDGVTYTVKIIETNGTLVIIYNENGKAIFAMGEPSAVEVPNCGASTELSSKPVCIL